MHTTDSYLLLMLISPPSTVSYSTFTIVSRAFKCQDHIDSVSFVEQNKSYVYFSFSLFLCVL